MRLKKLFAYIKVIKNLNIIKTLYFNFKIFKFRDACKLPCLFFGNVEIEVTGSVLFTTPIKTGLLKFGIENDGFTPKKAFSKFSIGKAGILEIRGRVDVGCGTVFRIIGHLILSNNSYIGSKSIIACNRKISIGTCSRIAFGSVIMDTNHHFIIVNKEVRPAEGTIHIGDYCWIGNNTTISKGCNLPNNTIVAAKSLVSHDFSDNGENCLLAGCPAKVKRTGIVRLYNRELERNIQEYFDSHENAESYCLTEEELSMINIL